MIPKFRYWHEQYGMCEINWMEFTLDTQTYEQNTFYLGGFTKPDDSVVKEVALFPKQITQATVFKDKHDNYIYYDDICVAIVKSTQTKHKGLIINNGGSLCFDISPFYPLAKEGWCENISGVMDIEILGNKFANPELLEDDYSA